MATKGSAFFCYVIFEILKVIFGLTIPSFSTFGTDNSSFTIDIIAFDNDTGQVFAGGTNFLYRLSSDLDIIQAIQIGPRNESVDRSCKPFQRDCIFAKNDSFKSTDNHVSIIQLYPNEKFFLVCETLHNGLCYLQTDKMNLSSRRLFPVDQRFHQDNLLGSRNKVVMIVSNISDSVNTESFFRDNMHFVARSYDGRPTTLFHTREFSTLKLYHYQDDYVFEEYEFGRSFLQVQDSLKDKLTFKIIFGYETDKHVYFVFIRSTDISGVVVTKLARICKEDKFYYSYIEIPVICKDQLNNNYRLATAGYYDAKNSTLYLAFGSRTHKSGNVPDVEEGSTLCSYTQIYVDRLFNAARHRCYTGHDGFRPAWMEMERNPGQQCKYHHVSFAGFCGTNMEPGIEALDSMTLQNVDVPTFKLPPGRIITTVYSIGDHQPTVFLGTSDGFMLKLKLKWIQSKGTLVAIGEKYAEYDVTRNRSVAIKQDLAVDPEKMKIFLISGNNITKIPLFSCAVHTQCGECITNPDPLNCGWCGEACTTQEECSGFTWQNKGCPPVVNKIFPSKGPTEGNTDITIHGEDFGSETSGTAEVNIGPTNCSITHRNNTVIICKTNEVSEEQIQPIAVTVTDDSYTVRKYNIGGTSQVQSFNFTFSIPKISGIHPLYGPALGKTLLTIKGDNLDIGASVDVYVSESNIKCPVLIQAKTQIVCRVSTYIETSNDEDEEEEDEESEKPDECEGHGPVEVLIDHVALESNEEYCYRPDPVISSVSPNTTIESGGLEIAITGKHFDTCLTHSLMFKLDGPSSAQRKECVMHNSSLLTCGYPKLKLEGSNQPSHGKMTILMDNITDFAQSSSDFWVYIDPVFYNLNSDTNFELMKNDKKILLLKGEGLNYALSAKDYTVLIDGQNCPVLQLTKTSLTCDLDLFLSNSSGLSESAMDIEIQAAGFITMIGSVSLKRLSNKGDQHTHIVVLGSVLGGCLFFMTIVIVCILKKKRLGPFKKHLQRFRGTDALEEGMTFQGLMSRIDADEPSSAIPNNYTPIRSDEGAVGGAMPDLLVDIETLVLLEKQNLLIDREYLVLGENIGHGQFGCVYKGYLSKAGEKGEKLVAVKTILKTASHSDVNIHEFLNEAMIMKDFNHRNVLTLIGVCVDKGEFPLVILPFMRNGDLLSYIRNEENNPRVRDLVSAGLDVCKGMEYLSGIKFVHRDLAARNCMLDENMVAKVADFGLSRDIYSSHYYSSDNKRKLPVKWMAPESLQHGKYSAKSDVWSYGVVVWELMTRGASPYNEVDNWDMFAFLKDGRRLSRPMYCPQELYDIMLNCWNFHVSKRPTFKQLVKEITCILSASERTHKVGEVMVDLDSTTSTG